jgi:DNA mismatch repair protein MutH
MEIAYETWTTSRVRRKLTRVLFVPIDSAPVPLPARRFGAPRLFCPTPDEEATLRADWEDLVARIALGGLDDVTGYSGRHLQVRPKAAHGDVRAFAPGPDETTVLSRPRGFYLRATFTATVLGAPAREPASSPREEA